jgi:hypothetical protein
MDRYSRRDSAILGAEKRLSEYEAILYIKLQDIEANEKRW